MMPAFSSWSAFFAMGGYAFYVWLAVSMTLLTLLGLVMQTHWQRRQLLGDIRRQQARAQRVRRGGHKDGVAKNLPVSSEPGKHGSGGNTPEKMSGEDAL